MAAIDLRNFITLAQLLASGNHPVCEIEHGPCKDTGMIYMAAGGHELFQTDMFYFIQNFLTVIFRHKFITPVVHDLSFGETDCCKRGVQSLQTLGQRQAYCVKSSTPRYKSRTTE